MRKRIGARIDALKKEPRPAGIKQLQSTDKRFRLRVGDYRIIYKIFDDILVVLVIDLGTRGSIYR
jgi:mRNA interferase RelE/StbE